MKKMDKPFSTNPDWNKTRQRAFRNER